MTLFPAGLRGPTEGFPPGPIEPPYFSEIVAPTRQLCWMVDFDGDTAVQSALTSSLLGPAGLRGPTEFGTIQRTTLSTQRFRFATHPFITSATDSPAHTPVEGRMQPIRISRELEIAANGAYSPMAISAAGEVALTNDDGELDAILGAETLALEGRPISVSVAAILRNRPEIPAVSGVYGAGVYQEGVYQTYQDAVPASSDSIGEVVMPTLKDFNRVFVGVIDTVTWQASSIRLRITDDAVRLGRAVQDVSFTGGGGIDGMVELAGVTRPVAYGQCFNVTPVQIDPFRLTYMFHGGEARAVDAVFDRGVPLRLYREVDTFDQLAALEPVDPIEAVDGSFTIGTYAACPKAGCFRLGGIAAGRVTANVRGAGSVDGDFEYWDDGTLWADGTGWEISEGTVHAKTAPQVAITLLQDAGIFDINVQQFRQLDDDEPRDVGLYLEAGGSRTVGECVGYVLNSNGCFLLKGGDGLYQLRRLVPPGVESLRIGADAIVQDSLERVPLPWKQPWSRWKVRYARNWSPMPDSEIAEAVEPDKRTFFKREAAESEAVDDATGVIYPARGPGVADTALVRERDARAQAARMRTFYGRGRQMYVLRSQGIGFRADLGETVRLQHPRFGLASGAHFVVVGLREDGVGRSTELTVLG